MFLIWFWHSTMRAREMAIRQAKRICQDSNVQLLDETVSMHKIRLARTESGAVGLKREYRFDYTLDGDERLRGRIMILGAVVKLVRLDDRKIDLSGGRVIEGRAKVIKLSEFQKKD